MQRRDFLLACRKDQDVANYLGLPQRIHQEGNSRQLLETVFQDIESNEQNEISIEEFVNHYRRSSVKIYGNQ